jgi:hypothetical protein
MIFRNKNGKPALYLIKTDEVKQYEPGLDDKEELSTTHQSDMKLQDQVEPEPKTKSALVSQFQNLADQIDRDIANILKW